MPNSFLDEVSIDFDAAFTPTPTKLDSVTAAGNAKKAALNEYEVQNNENAFKEYAINTLSEGNDGVYDGDDAGQGNRLASPEAGISFDAYETKKDDAWLGQVNKQGRLYNQERMRRQRKALAKERDVDPSSITNDDVFAEGEKGRNEYIRLMKEGQDFLGPMQNGGNLQDNPTIQQRPTGKTDAYGRKLVETFNPVTGKSLMKAMNNPEFNSGYDSGYNTTQRRKDKEFNRDRTAGEVIKDTALGLGKFTSVSGETLAGVGAFLGDTAQAAMGQAPIDVGFMKRFKESRDIMDDMMSDPTKRSKAKLQEAEFKWEAGREQREQQYEKDGLSDIEKGAKEQWGSFKNTGAAYLDNPLAIVNETIETLPHFLNAGSIGKFMIGRLTKGMSKEAADVFLKSDVGKAAVAKAASRAGISYTAVSEGMSNGIQVEQDILDTSFEDLEKNSEDFRKMVKTMTPDEARRQLAYNRKVITTGIAATIGGATSKVTGAGKFEGNIFSQGLEKTIAGRAGKHIASGLLRETPEEALQGAGGALAGNIGMMGADDNQELLEGTGSGAASGAILGATTGGGMSAATIVPKTAGDTINKAVDKFQGRKTNNTDRRLSETLSDPTLVEKMPEDFDVQGKVLDNLTDTAKATYDTLAEQTLSTMDEGSELTQAQQVDLASVAGITKDIQKLEGKQKTEENIEQNIYDSASTSTQVTLDNIAKNRGTDTNAVISDILSIPKPEASVASTAISDTASALKSAGSTLKSTFSKRKQTFADRNKITRESIQEMEPEDAGKTLLKPAYNKGILDRGNPEEIQEFKKDLGATYRKLSATDEADMATLSDMLAANKGKAEADKVSTKDIENTMDARGKIIDDIIALNKDLKTRDTSLKVGDTKSAVNTVSKATAEAPASQQDESRVSDSLSVTRGSKNLEEKFGSVLNSPGASPELKAQVNTRIASEKALESSGKTAEEVGKEVLTDTGTGSRSLRTHMDRINEAYHAKDIPKAGKAIADLVRFQNLQQQKIDILGSLPSDIQVGDNIMRPDGKKIAHYISPEAIETLINRIQHDTSIIDEQVRIYTDAISTQEGKTKPKSSTPSASTPKAKKVPESQENKVNDDIPDMDNAPPLDDDTGYNPTVSSQENVDILVEESTPPTQTPAKAKVSTPTTEAVKLIDNIAKNRGHINAIKSTISSNNNSATERQTNAISQYTKSINRDIVSLKEMGYSAKDIKNIKTKRAESFADKRAKKVISDLKDGTFKSYTPGSGIKTYKKGDEEYIYLRTAKNEVSLINLSDGSVFHSQRTGFDPVYPMIGLEDKFAGFEVSDRKALNTLYRSSDTKQEGEKKTEPASPKKKSDKGIDTTDTTVPWDTNEEAVVEEEVETEQEQEVESVHEVDPLQPEIVEKPIKAKAYDVIEYFTEEVINTYDEADQKKIKADVQRVKNLFNKIDVKYKPQFKKGNTTEGKGISSLRRLNKLMYPNQRYQGETPANPVLSTLANVPYESKPVQDARNELVNYLMDKSNKEVLARTNKFYEDNGYPSVRDTLLNNQRVDPQTMKTHKNRETGESAEQPFHKYIHTAGEMMLPLKKVADSVLGKIPDLFPTLNASDRANKKFIKDNDLTTDEAKHLNNTLMPWLDNFRNNFDEIFRDNVQYDTYLDDVAIDPIQLLKDANNGKIPDNVKDAIGISIRTWLATKATDTTYNEDETINKILNRNKETPVSADERNLLASAGTLEKLVTQDIGKNIRKQLNLGVSSTVEGNFEHRLDASLGLMGMSLASKMGLIEMNSIPNKKINDIVEGSKLGEKKQTKFIRLEPQTDIEGKQLKKDGLNVIEPEVQKIIDFGKGIEEGINKKLFNSNTGFRAPSSEPITALPKFLQGTIAELTPTMKKNILFAQQVEFAPKENMFKLADMLGTDRLLEINGYNFDNLEETLHYTEIKGVEGANRGIAKVIKAGFEYMGTRPGDYTTPYFQQFDVWKNNRSGLTNSDIDMQKSKYHRHMFGAKTWDATVELTGENKDAHIEQLQLAIGEGLDLKVTSDMLSNENFGDKVMNSKGEINEKFAAAVKLINKDKDSYSDSEKDIITEAIKAGKNEMYSADALMNLAAYKKALDTGADTVKINIGREIDGTTNGVVTGVLQLISNPDDNASLDILRAGGLFFEGDVVQTSQEYLEKPGNDDNYQSITKVVDNAIGKVLQEISVNAASGDKFRFGEIWGARGLNQNMNHILSIVDSFMSEMIDKELKVTKDGRNFSKNPLMITAYGAGIKKIKESIGYGALNKFYSDVGTAVNEKDQTKLDTLAKGMNQVLGLKTGKLTLNLNDALTDKFMEERIPGTGTKYQDRFIAIIGDTYGAAMETALEERLGDFTESRQFINNAVNISNKVFLLHYNKRFDALLAENSSVAPTRTEVKQIITDLRDEGILPTVKHATSTSVKDSLEFVSMGKEEVPVKQGGEIQQKYKKGSEIPYKLDGVSKTKASTSSIVQRAVPDDKLGVKPFLGMNISQDGNINAMRLGKDDGLNVFDAWMDNLLKTVDGTQDYNKIYYDLNSSYSIAEAVKEHFDRTMKTFNKLTPAEKNEINEGIGNKEGGIAIPGFVGKDKQYYQSIGLFNKEFQPKMDKIISAHNATVERLIKVDQFSGGNVDSVYEPKKQAEPSVKTATNAATAEALDPESNQRRSSESQMSMQDFEDTYAELLTAETMSQVFEDLGSPGVSNVQESQAHSSRLKQVIDTMVKPVLRGGDSLYLKHIEDSGEAETQGIIQGNVIGMKSTLNKPTTFVQMSSQEVFTHEMVHNVIETAMGNNYFYRREMQKLFRIAKNARDDNGYPIISYESFMTKNSQGSIIALTDMDAEVAAAKEMYEYVMNSKSGYLHEFAAFGLTNENFINDLNKIDNKEDDINQDLSYYEKFNQLMNNLFNWVTGAMYQTNNKKLDRALLQLGQRAATINVKAKGEVFSFSTAFNKINTTTIDIASKAIVKPYMNYLHKLKQNDPKNIITKTYHFGVSVPYMIFDAEFGKAVDGFLDFLGVSQSNIINLTLQELRGKKDRQKVWDRMLRNSKHLLDGSRERLTEGIFSQIVDSFENGKQISDDNWRALNNSILKTDMSSIFHIYNPTKMSKLLRDRNGLNSEIGKVEAKLEGYGKNADYYTKQAHSLGHLMATGKAGLKNQMRNAHNIATLHGRTNARLIGDVNEAKDIIDNLASLYAMKYTSDSSNNMAADLLDSEFKRDVPVNGIQRMIDQHMQFKDISLKRNFASNPVLMIKGYTKEQYNPKYSMKIGTLADKEKFEDEGYKITKRPIPKDSLDTKGSGKLYVYTSDHGLLGRFMSGITSLTSIVNKGSLLSETYMQSGMRKPAMEARDVINTMRQAGQTPGAKIKLDFSENHMVPVLNDSGFITDYAYVMSESNKVELMGKDDKAPMVLASMTASIEDKVNTNKINRAVVEQAKEEFNKYGLARRDKFIELGPDSKGVFADYYKLMPEQMKQDIKDIWGQDSMRIEESMLGTVIGFRKASIFNTKYGKMLPRVMRHNARLAANLWSAVVKTAKHKIVILIPAVLQGNVISNSIILGVRGVGPTAMMTHQVEATAALSTYLDTIKARDNLQREIDNSSDKFSKAKVKNMTRQVGKYNQDIDANPVHKLVSEGLYQTIVEDITINASMQNEGMIAEAIPSSWGGDRVRGYLENVRGTDMGRKAYWGYKQATLAPDTATGKFLLTATQRSDFVARYALYKHLTEVEGISHKAAIEDVMETFIDYNVNTSPEIQWANDMGILMFTKFLFRIQRVIMRMVKHQPGSLLAAEAAQRALGVDLPDITDSFILTSLGANKVTTPDEIIDAASTISSLNYLDFLIP